MKKPLIVLVALLSSHLSTAQKKQTRTSHSEPTCRKVYIGLGTGINYQSGFLGLNIDVPVVSNFSLGTGAGFSTWGYKLYGEARYYFKPCNRGFALGAGLTYNTGLQGFTSDMPTTFGTQPVTMDLHGKLNTFVCGYHFFNMGKTGHRFHLQLGYSIPLSDDDYTITSYDELSSDGEAVMDILSPGGLIFGFGFTFGIGGR